MELHQGTPAMLEALCRRLSSSDRDAFEKVFRLFREDLVRYVRSIVGDTAVANDLVQDVFVSLWETRESLDPSLSLKAFVYRIARNAAYRYLRDTRTHHRKHEEIRRDYDANGRSGEAKEFSVDSDLLAVRLRVWIAELPGRQREALVLSRYHGLSHNEIAALMQISPRTVNNHIMRALEHLQDRVRMFEPALLKS